MKKKIEQILIENAEEPEDVAKGGTFTTFRPEYLVYDLLSLFQSEMEKTVDDLFSEESDMWLNAYDWNNFSQIAGIIEDELRKKLANLTQNIEEEKK